MKEEERGKGREGNHNFLEIARRDRVESYTILIANPLSKGRKRGRGKRRGKKGQSWTSAMETAAAASPVLYHLSLSLSLFSPILPSYHRHRRRRRRPPPHHHPCRCSSRYRETNDHRPTERSTEGGGFSIVLSIFAGILDRGAGRGGSKEDGALRARVSLARVSVAER